MVHLSFKVKSAELKQNFKQKVFLSIEIKNLKVYWEGRDEELIEKVGSFGHANVLVNDIKKITTVDRDNNLLFILLGFKLNPNFTFKVNIDKYPDWLCANTKCVENNIGLRNGLDNVYESRLDFAYHEMSFSLVDHPLSNQSIKEIKELIELITKHAKGNEKTKENFENTCKNIENCTIFQTYKRKLNDQLLMDLQERLEILENEKEELIKSLEREREAFEMALDNAEEWHQRDLEAKVKQRIKELQLDEKNQCLIEKSI